MQPHDASWTWESSSSRPENLGHTHFIALCRPHPPRGILGLRHVLGRIGLSTSLVRVISDSSRGREKKKAGLVRCRDQDWDPRID